jgi:Fe-S cluster assembly protein SufD
MSGPLAERIAREHAAIAESLPAGGASASAISHARRRRAIDALLASGLPTTRDENWRYAHLRPLERVRFAPARAGALPSAGVWASRLPQAIPGFARYVFLDGALAPEGASPPAGVAGTLARVTSGMPVAASLEGDAPQADAAFALLNEAFAIDGLRIETPAGAPSRSADAVRIEVIYLASAPGDRGASYPRLSVVAAPHSRLILIERHLSLADEASFVDAAIEVRAHEGACIEHYRLQQLGSRALCLETLSASVARAAAYRLHAFGIGAQSARSTMRVRLEGEGAELALHAVAAGDGQQVLDSFAVVDHASARTRTDESFRGVAAGRSRVAFNGKIIVRPGARGADSSQSLRGLLAGASAEIDVRPQLEIYTDDVRCSHGATAGKLDESMLFYLLSRGLDRDTAQRLLKWAFLEDVVSKVAVPELRRQVESSLAGQLQESETLKELL